jgi:hypothetical protein
MIFSVAQKSISASEAQVFCGRIGGKRGLTCASLGCSRFFALRLKNKMRGVDHE